MTNPYTNLFQLITDYGDEDLTAALRECMDGMYAQQQEIHGELAALADQLLCLAVAHSDVAATDFDCLRDIPRAMEAQIGELEEFYEA